MCDICTAVATTTLGVWGLRRWLLSLCTTVLHKLRVAR